MQLRRQIFNFFQKQRAAVRQFKTAQPAIFIVGGRTAHKILPQYAVGIQLTVHGDIRPAGALAFIVDGLTQQLFTNTLFPAQQDRETPPRCLASKMDQAAGFRIVSRHLLKGVAHLAELAGHQLAHLFHRMQ
ncbi:hypothetical protein SDC9_182370 [bioreactor metagenome]|uniref:Uncharacterized protein n=1 Tax=bioreactor metagenome TaxID=1076179 RepID=A0A645H8P2_9ZZZZ